MDLESISYRWLETAAIRAPSVTTSEVLRNLGLWTQNLIFFLPVIWIEVVSPVLFVVTQAATYCRKQ